MSDHAKPVLASTYSNFLLEFMNRIDDAVKMGRSDTVTLTNPPTGYIRYNATSGLWQQNTGTPAAPTWGVLKTAATPWIDVEWGATTEWRKIADVLENTSNWASTRFEVKVSNPNGNFGGVSADTSNYIYHVTTCRTGSTTPDNPNSGFVSGPDNSLVRLVKTATGVYEIQVGTATAYRQYKVAIRVVADNLTATVTYLDGTLSGSTTGTNYLALDDANGEEFVPILSARVLTSRVATGTAPFVVASTTVVPNLNVSFLNGKSVGTSGNAIPLLDGVNSWTAAQSSSSTYTAPKFLLTSGSSNGIGFWDNLPLVYGMLMSGATDGTYGGRVPGDTTSDYNLYFTIGTGTNRGFVFRNAYATPLFGINSDRVRSNVGLSAVGGVAVTALATAGVATGTPSTTGGTMAATTTYAKIQAFDINGHHSLLGAESTGVVTTGTTASIVWTWTAVQGAISYRIWVGATGVNGNYAVVTTNTYTQTLPSASLSAGTPFTNSPSGSLTVPGRITTSEHVYSNYLYMSHSASVATTDTVFYSSTDGYIRKNTATGLKTSLALQNVTNESKTTMFASPILTGQTRASASGIYLPASTGMAAATGDTAGLRVDAQGTAGTAGAAFMTFHRPGAYAAHFGIDIDSKWKVGGWSMGAFAYEIFHLGNIGTILTSGHVTTALGYTPSNNTTLTSSVISGNTTAVAGTEYVFTATLTLTLPASPTAGNIVRFSNMSGVSTCVIGRNSKNIMSLAENMTLDSDYGGATLMFADATRGWVLI